MPYGVRKLEIPEHAMEPVALYSYNTDTRLIINNIKSKKLI